ncbi:MAG: Hsp20/alpha crystallin family protein, partial [Omnitrophica bacterium]|nr:Hsp20/alpha crystallin family protein [Candidatus Omnitrophota bacterium]
MKLIRYRPENSLSILETLHDEIGELFNFPFSNFGLCQEEYFSPSLDVYEDKDNVYVEAELPGLEKKDIKISLRGRTLAISGKKEEENKEKKSLSFFL